MGIASNPKNGTKRNLECRVPHFSHPLREVGKRVCATAIHPIADKVRQMLSGSQPRILGGNSNSSSG